MHLKDWQKIGETGGSEEGGKMYRFKEVDGKRKRLKIPERRGCLLTLVKIDKSTLTHLHMSPTSTPLDGSMCSLLLTKGEAVSTIPVS